MSKKIVAVFLFIAALSTALFSRSVEPTIAFSFRIGDYGDNGVALSVDAQGNSYIVGSRWMASTPFPITDRAAQRTPASMFVAKVDARGERVVWATYLGGSRNRNWYWRGPLELPNGIATDPEGNVLVIGSTAAVDFPVENALVGAAQPTGSEGFLTKISADGSRLLYSTYLGGGHATSVATDFAGFAYVAIHAPDRRLPFERLDLSTPGNMGAVVVARINPSGQVVVATRFGTPQTTITALAPDSSGALIVAGSTSDRGFPLVQPVVTTCWRGPDGSCASPYVAKLDATATRFVYSTLLAGTDGPTTIGSMAVDARGSAWVAGTTRASDYPVVNAYQPASGGGEDYVLSKIGPAGTLESSTYLGGDVDETALGSVPRVLVDLNGRPVLIGATASLNGLGPQMPHPDVPLWRSTDDGISWHASSRGLRTSAWAMAVSERDRIWYLGTSDGVYRSVDGGDTWQRAVTGSADQEIFKIAVDPSSSGRIYAGTRGGTYRSDNRGDTWTRVDAMAVSGGPSHPAAHAALIVDGNGTVFLGTEGIRRSSDGGVTWVDVSGGLERGPTNHYGPVQSIVFDPHVPGTIYALHSSRPYRSRDGGSSWTRLGPAHPPGSSFGIGEFYGLSVPPGRPGRVYASGWTEVLRSDNEGAEWTMLLNRELFRAQFLIHPARPETVYAFDSWAGEPLVVSYDAGTTWKKATLPRSGQRAFALDPLQPGVLFAPSDIRTLPFLAGFDADVRRLVYSSFLDPDPPRAAAMDLTGHTYLIRSVGSRTVLVKLQIP